MVGVKMSIYEASITNPKKQLEFYKQLSEQWQQENKSLKDNWNYIKKMLKEARNEEFNIIGYCGTCTDVDIDFLLNKMQELQGSDSKWVKCYLKWI